MNSKSDNNRPNIGIWALIRCPRRGCNGEIKENGFGFFRCRRCDTEFKINYFDGCKHEYEEPNMLCVHCGDEENE